MNDKYGIIENTKIANETLDAELFVKPFAEDAIFQLGTFPAVQGKEKIQQSVEEFFAQGLQSVQHDILEMWDFENELVYYARVTWIFQDGTRTQKPYVNHIQHHEGSIREYKVFVET